MCPFSGIGELTDALVQICVCSYLTKNPCRDVHRGHFRVSEKSVVPLARIVESWTLKTVY